MNKTRDLLQFFSNSAQQLVEMLIQKIFIYYFLALAFFITPFFVSAQEQSTSKQTQEPQNNSHDRSI